MKQAVHLTKTVAFMLVLLTVPTFALATTCSSTPVACPQGEKSYYASSGSSVCASGGFYCAKETTTSATQKPSPPKPTTSTQKKTPVAAKPTTPAPLSFGSRGSAVITLQQQLITLGYLAADSATGFFGNLTKQAVAQFQIDNNLEPVGYVGPKTKAALAAAQTTGIVTPTATPPTAPAQSSDPISLIASLLAQVKALQDKIATLKGTAATQSGTQTSGSSGGGTAPTSSAPTCTLPAPSTETRTSTQCPTGQTGTITETRMASCPSGAASPAWGAWQTTSNTCVVPQKTVLNGALDPIDWMTTNKGTGHVRGYFETWNGNTWVSGTGGVAQPFKMFADTAASQIYWRKDMPAETQRGDGKDYEFSGEIYTFDASSVRLRFESMYFFPCPALGRCDPIGQAWDIRADKFRLFVDGTGPLDTTEGLFFIPRPVWNGWSHGPYPLATYYCNSFSEFHQSTCSLYQKNDKWGWVTVEAYNNYDIFNADGDQVVATPDGTPQQRIYDVLIVSQEQQVTNFSESVPAGTARGAARERFFYGKIGNDKYGFIRWDSAKNINGQYVLDARTVGYAWDTSYNPQFSEMQARGAEER